jgi:hypothetical protein
MTIYEIKNELDTINAKIAELMASIDSDDAELKLDAAIYSIDNAIEELNSIDI